MSEGKILGRSYPRIDAADKVSGRMQYAGDIYLPGMLMCKVLQSTKPHARPFPFPSCETSRFEFPEFGFPRLSKIVAVVYDQ